MTVELLSTEASPAPAPAPFPQLVLYLGLCVTLRAEAGRRRIVYDYRPKGGAREKKVIPVAELPGAAGEVPADGIVPEKAIEWAKGFLDRKLAEMSATGRAALAAQAGKIQIVQDDLTISHAFTRIRSTSKFTNQADQQRGTYDKVLRWVEAVLGSDFSLLQFDDDTVNKLYVARRYEGIVVPAKTGDESVMRRLQPADHNTTRQELANLRTALSWLTKIKRPDGSWFLEEDPFARIDLPKFRARRKKSRILPGRYELMRSVADRVDPTGRFGFMLDLARWFGMREATWCRFRRGYILFTVEEIEAALKQQLNKYVADEQIHQVAGLYAENGGAIFAPWHTQKQGLAAGGAEGVVEQYDRVVPMGPRVSGSAHVYLDEHWPKFGLTGADAPLFPSDNRHGQAIHKDSPQKWWVKAESLIRAEGTPLPVLQGTRWAGFRLQRLHELRVARIDELERYFVVGWSLHEGSGASDEPLTMAEGVYGRADPAILVRASKVGEGNG